MTTLYLIRHAEAEGNVYRRFHGWYDSLITPNGYRQIQALERRFEGVAIDAACASDLFRTKTTAGAVCRPRNLPLRTDPCLREIGGGVWEDKAWGELVRRDPERLRAFFHADPGWQVEGGETYASLQARVTAALRRIAAENEGGTVAVFSHGTAILSALAHFRGYPLDQIAKMPHGDNTAVSKLLFDGNRVEIEYFNDNSHLGGLSTLGAQPWKKRGLEGFEKNNLWFRPLDFAGESDFYLDSRREAWKTIHHTMRRFSGEVFLADARAHGERGPWAVLVAMRGEERAGILQMDLTRGEEQNVGAIPFFYMCPEHRAQGLGVQLLGQAVSTFRPLGRKALRLRCAPENQRARRFYERHGFRRVGEEPGGLGTLDVLEKPIAAPVS